MSRKHKVVLASLAVGLICSSAASASETIIYTYDARGRLVKVEHAGTVNNNVQAVYTYDDADNRTNVTVTGVVSLGPELVPGGDFASNTGWTLQNGASISGGKLHMNGGDQGRASVYSTEPVPAGTYKFEFDLDETDGNDLLIVWVGAGTTGQIAGSDVSGHFSGTFTFSNTTTSDIIRFSCPGNCTLTADNFSVRRVTA